MSIEAAFINGVVLIATAAAVIRFALFEWEGILRAWRRATAARKPRGKPGSQSADSNRQTKFPCGPLDNCRLAYFPLKYVRCHQVEELHRRLRNKRIK